jgi:hypothetical protein
MVQKQNGSHIQYVQHPISSGIMDTIASTPTTSVA